MSALHSNRDEIQILFFAVLIPCILFLFSLASTGERRLGVLETIHGIPYPIQSDGVIVLEDMAHTDLFLQEPVFAKQANFFISFDPGSSESIDIGIRENEFWLSYKKIPVYRKGIDSAGFQTKEISIPLSKVLQDIDRSVDVMIFTESEKGVQWRIQDFHASLEFDMPSVSEIKAYSKAIITRERAL